MSYCKDKARVLSFSFVVCIAAQFFVFNANAVDYPAITQKTPSKEWIITVGGLSGVGPKYQGSGSSTFWLTPSLRWRKIGDPEPFNFPDDSATLKLMEFGAFKLGVVGAYRAGRYSGSESKFSGIRDVRWAVEPGAFAEFWPIENQFRTRIEIRHGIYGHHGFVGKLSVDFLQKFDKVQFAIGPRLMMGDDSFMQKNFGISKGEALANGLVSSYRPSAGISSIGIAASAVYGLNEQWNLLTYAKYDRLVGDAGKSPVVRVLGDRNQFTIGVGANYSFLMTF